MLPSPPSAKFKACSISCRLALLHLPRLNSPNVNPFYPYAGIGGLGIVLARMATKWLLPPTEAGIKQSTNIFFIFSNSLIVLAVSAK